MSPFDRAHITSYLTNRNNASILYHFQVITELVSVESVQF